MSAEPSLSLDEAHRHFAMGCYNETWKYLENPNLSPSEIETMLSLSHASLYHWSQCPDVTQQNYSIGYWQLSRAYSVANLPERALHYGQLCLEHSDNEPPFYIGYAYEALARAASLADDTKAKQEYLAKAEAQMQQVEEADEREALEADLKTI